MPERVEQSEQGGKEVLEEEGTGPGLRASSHAECFSFACVTQEGGAKLEFIDLSFHCKRIPWLLY